jgi:hypothetical protein
MMCKLKLETRPEAAGPEHVEATAEQPSAEYDEAVLEHSRKFLLARRVPA